MQENSLYQNKEEALRDGWKVMLRYLERYRAPVILLSCLALAKAILNGLVPFITGRLIDALNAQAAGGISSSLEKTFIILGLWAAVNMLSACLDWISARKSNRLRIAARLQYIAEGMAHLLRLPIAFHKEHKTGAVAEIINNGATSITYIVSAYVVEIIPAFIAMLVGVVICFWVNVTLAVVLLVGIAIYVALLAELTPRTIGLHTQLQKLRTESIGYGHDVTANVSTVKQTASEDHERKQLQSIVVDRTTKPWIKLMNFFSGRGFVQSVIVTITQLSIFLASIALLRSHVITLGELVMFNGYANMVFWPFTRFAQQWGDMQDSFIAAANSGKVMQTPTEVYYPKKPAHLKQIKKEAPAVRFSDVSFSYKPKDPQVLDSISFSIAQGEKVALVGESGVGKSTLIDLLSRYYIQTSGTIELFGIESSRIPLKELRDTIAVVPQEIALFNATIRENIVYGSFGASDKKMKAAAHEAQADLFIKKFPQKYEQMVGNRGVKLSVGQKQRIAIARAMLRDPKILILDEPTSALDPQTEKDITEALERLMQGRTTFIIAHRLSTVRKADRIFVIRDGKIAEEGSHAELVAIEDGEYRKLYELHIGLHE